MRQGQWRRPLAATTLFGSGITVGLLTSKRFREETKLQLDAGVRFTRCAWAAAMVGLDYSRIEKRCENLDAAAQQQEYSRTHRRSADRMLYVCRSNGGIFNKLGQYISTMNNVLPQEYTRTLAVVQDRAPFQEAEEIRRVIQYEFGKSPEEMFSHFEATPIAAASLAQVHRARTKCGKDVAVKVQYPLLQKQIEKDLSTVKFLMKMLAYFFPDMEYTWMLPDFAENLRNELNFIQEGLNATRVASLLRGEHGTLGVEDSLLRHNDKVHIPDVYWKLTTNRVLTMEFIEGIKVTDTESLRNLGIDPSEVGSIVSRLFAELVHVHGLVHCDPHPGNIFVRRKPGTSPLPVVPGDSDSDTSRVVRKLSPLPADAPPQTLEELSSSDKARRAVQGTGQIVLLTGKLIGGVVPVLLALGAGAGTAAVVKELKSMHYKFKNRHKTAEELEEERKEQIRRQMRDHQEESRKRKAEKQQDQQSSTVVETKESSTEASSDEREPPPKVESKNAGTPISLSYALPTNDEWQVVLIDHGMYRRLDSSFRRAYSSLWKALLLRDKDMGLAALEGMNVSRENIELYYELLSLIFTFKPSSSNASLGQRMTKEDKQRLKDMFYENPIDGKRFLFELFRDTTQGMISSLQEETSADSLKPFQGISCSQCGGQQSFEVLIVPWEEHPHSVSQ
eukprot:gb/GECG01009438.1/.p1 GENE.gb/GECG01009438.1/~~gb/GECG01009438.1/.p1  ORF type:complete len:676 (+),score=102.85 gb/GECG01009438.1/:1-2028(+)